VYADEADMLNMALFGTTALQWRNENPNADGNIRDMATIEWIVCSFKHEKYQCSIDTSGFAAKRKIGAIKQNCYNYFHTS